MKKMLFFRNVIVLLLFFSYGTITAQNRLVNPNREYLKFLDRQNNAANPNAKTAATTCPTTTVPVTISAQDSTHYVTSSTVTIASGSTLPNCNQSIIMYATGGSTTNEITPCVSTEYLIYYTNVRNNVTETFYEGGQNVGCIGPSGCFFPIGGANPLLLISGLSTWSLYFGYLDPSLQHDFQFCRAGGSISTTTVTLKDCWTGATLAGPNVLSNATAGANSSPCFTMSIPAGTDIGHTSWSIAPATASVSLVDYGDGEAQVKTYMLPAGTYTATYTFSPPAASGCTPVSGTYTFTIAPGPTVNVNSPTICSGTTATLTASGTSTSYSWSPSTNLSGTTGSSVTFNGSSTTTVNVVGNKSGCFTKATSTITVNPTPTLTVNSLSICGGGTDSLKATGATSYSWSPATGLSSTTDSSIAVTPLGNGVTIYTVTGTSLGCSSSATATVTTVSNPSITVNNITICSGNSDTLKASGAATYTWSPSTDLSSANSGTVVANPNSTVSYTVSGSVGTCSAVPAIATVSVNTTPTVTVNSAVLCVGGTTTLTANGASSYSWSPSTGLSASTGSTVVANPTVTTTYTVTGAGAGSCSSSALSTVTVYSNPTFTVNKATICSGNSVSLVASDASLSYTWAPTATATVSITTDTAIVNPLTTTVYTITGTNPACPALTITDSVIVNISPYITVLSPTVCSGTSATITATGAISYTWTPLTNLTASVTNDTVYINNPTTNATYTVYGTAPNGCKDSAVSNVIISNHLGILSGTPINVCHGSHLGLSAIGASTYTWTSNDPTNLDFGTDVGWSVAASIANVGTYTVAIYGESHNGTYCNGYDTIKVTVNPQPVVTVGNNNITMCAGSTATLTAGGANSYSWTPNTNLSVTTGSLVTATPNATTTYTVTGTDVGGCADIATVLVNVIPIPSFTVNSTAICLGNSDSLKVATTTSVSGAQTYTWTPSTGLSITTGSAVSANPSAIGANIYTVSGTNSLNGVSCSSSATSTVVVRQLPTVTIAPNYSVCAGSTTTLTASGINTYSWTPNTNLSSTTGSTVAANPSSTTVYSVTGQDVFGCHANVASTTVTVITVTATASSNSPVCKGQTISLSANSVSGSANYSWSGPNGYSASTQNPTISNANPGTNGGVYTLTLTAGGCSAVSTTSVTVNNLPIVSVLPGTATVCPGTPVTYTASGANTYTWTPASSLSSSNGSTVTATTNSTTVYSVTGTDANTCSATATTTLNVSQVIAAVSASPQTGDAPLDVTFTNNSTGATTYTWNYGNGTSQVTTSTGASTETNYATQGVYTVTMIASNALGCVNTVTTTIVVTEGYAISIPNVFTPNGDNINDYFTIKGEGVSVFSIEIFDRWGLKVFSSSDINTAWDGKTSGGKEMSDGTYFYMINATSSKTKTTQSYKGYLTLIR